MTMRAIPAGAVAFFALNLLPSAAAVLWIALGRGGWSRP
jgi:hypothetical protein